MSTLRALIADDEAAARRAMMRALDQLEDIEVVAQVTTGQAVLSAVREHQPDLVFLDIRMPGMTGLEVSQALRGAHAPAVVFVTAHDEHAVEAFDLEAVDYVLKPIAAKRVAQAVRRVRQRIDQSKPAALSEPVMLRVAGRLQSVLPADVVYLEAAGNYVRVHTRESELLVRGTLAELNERLGNQLLRVHRSFAVRKSEIVEIRRPDGNDPTAYLRNGAEIPIGRTHWPELQDLRGRTGN